MKIKELGHVVLRVTNRERAEQFYNGLLGLPICARLDEGGLKMTFFTLGNHHDFAVAEVSGDGSSRSERAPGLDHVAFNIGKSLDDLREAKRKLEAVNAATRLDDLAIPPANRLERLKGDLKEFHSIRINGQWQVIFKWIDNEPHQVRIVDYH